MMDSIPVWLVIACSLISLVLMTFGLFMYSVSERLPILCVLQCEGHTEALGLDFPFLSGVS